MQGTDFMQKTRENRRGFAPIELVLALALLIVVSAVLALLAGDSRRRSALNADLDRLHWIGTATFSFAGDYDERFWTFSWGAGQGNSSDPALNNAETDLQAAANQAVELIRRRSPAESIQPIRGWIPHPHYSHLVLAAYMNLDLPDERFISVRDRTRMRWARDPLNWRDSGVPTPDGTSLRWPFSSSFEMPPAFYSYAVAGANAISQGTRHDQWVVPYHAGLGRMRGADVRFPSDKAFLYDTHGRHTGPRQLFFGYEDARVPVLTAGGNVVLNRSRDGNPGWDPQSPVYGATFMRYSPEPWEPGTRSGESSDVVRAFYRFTAMGLAGRDFGGPEVRP